jgi:hypothetical protein
MGGTTYMSERPAPGDRWLDARLHDDVAAHFQRLRLNWETETAAYSSLTSMVMHPAYQQIIGLGPQVVPVLIDDLRSSPGHWFCALRAIVGEDKAYGAATVPEAAAMWVGWFEALD